MRPEVCEGPGFNPYLHFCQGTVQLQIAQGQIQIHCNSHLHGILHLKPNRIAGRSRPWFFQINILQVYSVSNPLAGFKTSKRDKKNTYQLMHLALLPWSCSWWNSNNAHVSSLSTRPTKLAMALSGDGSLSVKGPNTRQGFAVAELCL